jgi:XTP/dITP diphosphohydrolase
MNFRGRHEYMKILIATGNGGKVKEFRSLLTGSPFHLLDLSDFPDAPEVAETGATFAENARLKATMYASHCGVHTLADDSGLEVEAIGGRPGVMSARYAGESSGYNVKIPALLYEIERANPNDRRARFAAHIAFASPTGEILFEAEGVCEGRIALSPRGAKGFGYDPVFIPDGFDETFGELGDGVKKSLSHRARALAKIMRYLRDFA